LIRIGKEKAKKAPKVPFFAGKFLKKRRKFIDKRNKKGYNSIK
jgi:hypothetical protein